jgi:hypothetical protein
MWTIRRNELIAGLDILSMVPEKLGVPSSEYFYVRGKGNKIKLSVASYIAGEIELEGQGDWPMKDAFFLDRRTLIPFVLSAREIKEKHRFKFERKRNQIRLSHGAREAFFDSQNKITGYGKLKSILKHRSSSLPVSDDLKQLLICGKNCAVSDSVVPELNCCYITKGSKGVGLEAYASSGKVYYLGTGKIGEGKVKEAIPFPLYLISLLPEQTLKKISWIGKYVMLTFDKGMIWQPISEEALTQFPVKNIRKHAIRANKLPITFTASSRRFSKLMIRLGYYLQSVRRKDWIVKLNGSKYDRKLKATTSIPGVLFKEELSISDAVKKNFKMEWPLDIMQPVFEFLALRTKKVGVVVRLDEKHGVSYIQAGNYWLAITSKQEE